MGDDSGDKREQTTVVSTQKLDRYLGGTVLMGGAGLASVVATFGPWYHGFVDGFAEGWVEGRWSGWELFTEFGGTFSWETASGSHTAFTGWATLLVGLLLIAVAILLAITRRPAADRSMFDLPYPRWAVRTARWIGGVGIALLSVTGFMLLIGGVGTAVWLFGVAALTFFSLVAAVPPEDFM